MMKMTASIVALAGLVIASTASAQSMFDAVKKYRARTVAASTVNGQPAVNVGGSDAEEVLYKNDTGTFFSTTSVPHTLGGDIMSFNPGPGAGTTGTITKIAPGFVVNGTVPVSFDILISFWDDTNFAAPAGMPVHENQMGPTLRVGYTNVNGGFYYNTSPAVTLPAPIAYDDDTFFYRVEFVEPGTNTRKPDGTVTFGFANSDATTGPNPGSSPTPPPNTVDTYYRDAGNNGIVEVADLRSFAAPNRANMGMVITGEAAGGGGCYADCDTSTGVNVLDIFDFLCFQNSFSNSEPYACECDTSTGVNVCDIFDFLCFQNAFSNGCP